MSKIVELRPNKNLLNKNFEKYQFSPDNVAVTEEKSLSKGISRLIVSRITSKIQSNNHLIIIIVF